MTWAVRRDRTSWSVPAPALANSELVCRRLNLAVHWARIGVVGAPRAVWRAGSIILAGIIKQGGPATPTSQT
jgi:hypothetical protein